MTTTYRASRRDQRIADDFLDGHGPCRFCGASTPKDDLNTFGARCRPCYDEYCRGGQPPVSLTPQQRRDMAAKVRAALGGQLRLSGREHIAQLQRRADAGEGLSAGQRGFLQAVRRASGIVDDLAPAAVAHATSAPVDAPPPAPMHVEQVDEEPPPWVLEDIDDADPAHARAFPAPEFPAPNDAEVPA